jgi:hypothetical protein
LFCLTPLFDIFEPRRSPRMQQRHERWLPIVRVPLLSIWVAANGLPQPSHMQHVLPASSKTRSSGPLPATPQCSLEWLVASVGVSKKAPQLAWRGT